MATQQLRRITKRPTGPAEPVLAAVYKVFKYIDRHTGTTSDNWEMLGAIRYMLGQRSRQMDGVTYSEMRAFIRDFLQKWGII